MIKISLSLLLLTITGGIWAGSVASAPTNRMEQALVEAYPEVYGVSGNLIETCLRNDFAKEDANGQRILSKNMPDLVEFVKNTKFVDQRLILQACGSWSNFFLHYLIDQNENVKKKTRYGLELKGFHDEWGGVGRGMEVIQFETLARDNPKPPAIRLVLPPMQEPQPPSYSLPPKDDQRGIVIRYLFNEGENALNSAWARHFLQMYAYEPYCKTGKLRNFLDQNFQGDVKNLCQAFDLADLWMIMKRFETFDKFRTYFDVHGIKPQGLWWSSECWREGVDKSRIQEFREMIKATEHLHFPPLPTKEFVEGFFKKGDAVYKTADKRLVMPKDGKYPVWERAAEFFGYRDKCRPLTQEEIAQGFVDEQDAVPPKKPEDLGHDIPKIVEDFNRRKEQRKQLIDQQVSAILAEMKAKGIPEDNLEYFARRLADFVPAMEGYGDNARHNRDDFRKRLIQQGASREVMDKFENMIISPFISDDLKKPVVPSSSANLSDLISQTVGNAVANVMERVKLIQDWEKFTKDFKAEKSPEMRLNPARWYSRFPLLRKETIDAWIEVRANPEMIIEVVEDAAEAKPSAEELKLVKQKLREQYAKIREEMKKEGIEPDMTKHFARKLAFYCAAQSDEHRQKFVDEAKRYLKEEEKATEEVLNTFVLAASFPFIPEAYLDDYLAAIGRKGEGNINEGLMDAVSEWKQFVLAVQEDVKRNSIDLKKIPQIIDDLCKRFPKIERDTINWWIQCQKDQVHGYGIALGYLACVARDRFAENIQDNKIITEKFALLCINHDSYNRDAVVKGFEKIFKDGGATQSDPALRDFRFRLKYPKEATEMSREDFDSFIVGKTEHIDATPTQDQNTPVSTTPPFIAQKVSDAISMIAPEFAEKTALPALSAVINTIKAPFVWLSETISDGFSWLKSKIFG